MANVIINDTHLVNIANAIREKNGLSDTYTPGAMATAISAIETGGGSADLPEEAYKITDNCNYRFAYGGWDWFLREYGDKITTENIKLCDHMFDDAKFIEKIPFEINLDSAISTLHSMFKNCNALKTIPKVNLTPTAHLTYAFLFMNCYSIQELPEWVGDLLEQDVNLPGSNANWTAWGSMFQNCSSLREIPDKVMLNMKNPGNTGSYYSLVYSKPFAHCRALNKLTNIYCDECEFTSNQFSGFFEGLSRVKDITFATEEDGSPCVRNWKNQTIDLTQGIGYGNVSFTYISTDKNVETDEDYQALKNDPDWYTQDIAYSRYNHDSAVATINSLPDTSGSGGTNTIKFKGASGERTDGGAINTLTDEEIAVAAAKGWTVSLV